MTNRPRLTTISQAKSSFLSELFIILLLALLPCLFFWRLLAPKPEDRLAIVEGDFTEQYFPLRAFSAAEWVNGRVPLWNPALYGGQPALADPQSGALYPPHILEALLLGWGGVGFPIWALAWQVIVHFSIAAMGAYLLGRYWGLRTGASLHSARLMGLVLSVTFTYSGYLTGFPVQQMTILSVSVWLPWVMLALSRTLDAIADQAPWQKILSRAAWTSLAFALAVLAGHPQTVMYIFYLTLAWVVIGSWLLAIGGQQSAIKMIIGWGVAIGLGLLISAAQLLPTLEFIGHSLRADLSFRAVSGGLPLSELVTILYPGYFGGSPAYVGIVPLVLIAAAIVLARPPLRRIMLFWLGVGLVSMLLAFGANTFLNPLFYLLVPGFDVVRQQERVFLLYSFAAAVLAGYGALLISLPFDRPTRLAWQSFQRNLLRIGAVALALTGLFIYGSTAASERGEEVNLFFGVLRHHVFGLVLLGGSLILLALRPRLLWRRWWGIALLVSWIGFNLFSVNWRFNLGQPPEPPLFTPVGVSLFLIEHTRAQGQPVRVASNGQLRGGNNAASVHSLEDTTGNTPLQLASVATFAEQVQGWRFWQLMNVLYVVDERDIDSGGLARRYEADGLKVFEITDPFPRARVVHQVIEGDDVSLLAQDAVDLKTMALIPSGTSISLADVTPPSTVLVTNHTPGHLEITVDTGSDGLLIVSNINYPGWQATLDGQPTGIVPTNGIFQGITVPAGRHQLTLIFKPDSFRRGSYFSLIGILLAVGLIVWGMKTSQG